MKKLYSFYDRVAEAYSEPISDVGETPVIVRGLKECLDNPSFDAPWKKYIEDTALYCLGEFEEITGCVVGYEQPKFLFNLTSLLKGENVE